MTLVEQFPFFSFFFALVFGFCFGVGIGYLARGDDNDDPY